MLVPPEVAEKWGAALQRQQDVDCWVHPENWPVVDLWQLVGGEWELAPMGGLHRLDWPAVERLMRWYQVAETDELMQGLHLFARAYRNETNRLIISERKRK